MSMWRCPHCGSPQPEAARCWVCHRSSTTCSTCRHFRRSLAATVGYCGLDRRRAPLRGLEHRGCWDSASPGPPGVAVGITGASMTGVPSAPGAALGGDRARHDVSADRAVARLRPGARPSLGLLEGFVPIELADRGPRTLRAVDPAPLPPAGLVDAGQAWTDRETLFGDL